MKILRIMLVMLFIFPFISYADGTKSTVKKANDVKKQASSVEKSEKLQELADSLLKEKYLKCMLSFGDDAFCQCLCKNLPVLSSFENYIAIVTTKKEDLNYSQYTDVEKKAIDLTVRARGICVNEVIEKNKKKK
ncbi:MAG TPA: hypothetical protein PLB69_05110 [Smithellaceae bacterium]|nr:hypothetical protein [Smithellaceae bacterium]